MSAMPNVSGPKGSFLLGNLKQFGQDPLQFLEQAAEFGDFVPLRFLNRRVYLLNHPDDIESVLTTQSKKFRKTIGYRTRFMRRLFGQGLLTSEGTLWTQQRRLAQPAFHRERIAGYARVIVQFAEEILSAWQPGETRDLHDNILKLTTRVVVKTLFNAEVPPSIGRLGHASAVVLERFSMQWNLWRLLTALLPTPGWRAFEQVLRKIDAFIMGVIAERRRSNAQDKGDLLSMLLLARDEAGQGMSDQQLRDELVTLMVAGLDTTALAVSSALFLLAKNEAAQQKAAEELEQALAGRSPSFGDVAQLRFADAVLQESMRLYPPAWIVGREPSSDCEVRGQPIRKGRSLIMS